MTAIRHGSYTHQQVQRSYVQKTANTVENQIGKIGDAVTDVVSTGVNVAVNAVAGTAKLGVHAIGYVIDTWA